MRRKLVYAVLVLAGCAYQPEPPHALSNTVADIATRHIHGTRDNDLTVDQREGRLLAGDLVSYCAEVVSPAKRLLDEQGWETHHIAFHALKPDMFGVYRGHHVLEVLDGDKWVTVDLDYGRMYRQGVAEFVAGPRTIAEPLEPRSDNPGPYYSVSVQAWAICTPGACFFNRDLYTPSEQQQLIDEAGWEPWPGDFNAHFYG